MWSKIYGNLRMNYEINSKMIILEYLSKEVPIQFFTKKIKRLKITIGNHLFPYPIVGKPITLF